ncbi:MAG: LCP family protein, partial [Proteobacteria bacterium]|nr:LCP family protein [Pseudomonadota bacterium]
VEQVSGIGIDHYMAVRFGGFRDIVDAVGGVDLCVERDIDDPFAGVNIKAGCQTLTGRQALGFVRSRKLDNDLERIKRQQQFLGGLADKIARPSTVLDPGATWQLTGAIGDALTADEGLGLLDLARLGLGARGLAGGEARDAGRPGDPGGRDPVVGHRRRDPTGSY